MSLDVYLYSTGVHACEKCGHEQRVASGGCVYDSNITHNLTEMASEAGIYYACWRPALMLDAAKREQIEKLESDRQWSDARGIEATLPKPIARDLIEPLRAGLARMKSDRAHFEKFNAPNGWGKYEHFVPWVEKYLAACEENPLALVEVSR
jgi:hypothetical protein